MKYRCVLFALAVVSCSEERPPAAPVLPEKSVPAVAPRVEAPVSTTPAEVQKAIDVAVSLRTPLPEREAAITELMELGHKDAVLPLAALLEPVEGSESLVPLAEEALKKLGAAKVLHASLEGTAGEERARRLMWLAKVGGPNTFEIVAAELRSVDAEVREQAAASLGAVGDSRAVPMLGKALADGTPAVRMAAAQSLGRLGGREAVGLLSKAEAGEQDGFVKPVMTGALAAARGRR